MSWIQKLYDTYEYCAGNEPDGVEPLPPPDHINVKAHIEIVIDGQGNIRRGRSRVLVKEKALIPVTEKSLGRTSGEAPHPLSDKIQYCAKDYKDFGGKKESYFEAYQKQLEKWCNSKFSHPKVKAVFAYINKGTLVKDLIEENILLIQNGILIEVRENKKIKKEQINNSKANKIINIFGQLAPKDEGEERVKDQGDALIRWLVEENSNSCCSETWKDKSLQKSWHMFNSVQQKICHLYIMASLPQNIHDLKDKIGDYVWSAKELTLYYIKKKGKKIEKEMVKINNVTLFKEGLEKINTEKRDYLELDPHQIDILINLNSDDTQSRYGFCQVSAMHNSVLAAQHPSKLRNGADQAKLISSNDSKGYTYRGRFQKAHEAVSVSFEVSQKAHIALRWLIEHQGGRGTKAGQVFVAWSCTKINVPDPFCNTLELLGINEIVNITSTCLVDTSQTFAKIFNNALIGYSSKLKLEPMDDIVVIGLDSATDGRMAITYYRELKGSDLLNRIESWHTNCAWLQNLGWRKEFIVAPSPMDIAESVLVHVKKGESKKKLLRSIIERLIPCIIDARPLPRDIVKSITRCAVNRIAFKSPPEKKYEDGWEKCLGIACALNKCFYLEENYQMILEEKRIERDYLYGRLLALADNIEEFAIRDKENRPTNAARLMSRFADRPASTWRTIYMKLTPYINQLLSKDDTRFINKRRRQLGDVYMLCEKIESFDDDRPPLSGRFLIGYYCQREELKKKKQQPNSLVQDELPTYILQGAPQ